MKVHTSGRRVAAIGVAAAAAAGAMATPAMAAGGTGGAGTTATGATAEPVVPLLPTGPLPALAIRSRAICPAPTGSLAGPVCLYYFSSTHRTNGQPTPYGARWQYVRNDPNLVNNRFNLPGATGLGATAGLGRQVGNNAEAVWNRGNVPVRLCLDTFYGGACRTVNPSAFPQDLPAPYRNGVESIIWRDYVN